MIESTNSLNLNWTFWLLILLGNGVIMTLVTLFQQWLFHCQVLKLDKEKHKQNLELEEKKRADYLICKNYDELFEIAKILNQILFTWWQIASNSEDQKKKVEISLWDFKCPIYDRFKTEQVQFGVFIKQYYHLVPKEVCDKMSEAQDEYKKNNFKEVKKLTIDAELALNNLLGIKRSQEEIKKRFEVLSK